MNNLERARAEPRVLRKSRAVRAWRNCWKFKVLFCIIILSLACIGFCIAALVLHYKYNSSHTTTTTPTGLPSTGGLFSTTQPWTIDENDDFKEFRDYPNGPGHTYWVDGESVYVMHCTPDMDQYEYLGDVWFRHDALDWFLLQGFEVRDEGQHVISKSCRYGC